MEKNRQSLPKEVIRRRRLFAAGIAIVWILSCLYLYGILKIPFLDNSKFKLAVTLITLPSIVVYLLIRCYKLKSFSSRGETFTALSAVFEIMGSWWLESFFGYCMIFLGFIFLLLGFIFLFLRK